MLRSSDVKKLAFTTTCMAVLSCCTFAQPSRLALNRLLGNKVAADLSYIPSKSFTNPAYRGTDSISLYKEKTISTKGFYAGRFEVSNKEYRDFVIDIRDSIAHILLGHTKGNGGINWNQPIDWNDPRLESLMIPPGERIFGKSQVDPGKIVYRINQSEVIPVYPDTLVWMNDFSYSYNEPLVKKYFSFHEYDNYPVVGVDQQQALAFCRWKTTQLNSLLKQESSGYEVVVRLPTHAEWEAAAINGNAGENEFYSSPYQSNFGAIYDKNGFLVKDYADDGYFYTNPVRHFRARSYGLYNMKGNIAEWTSDKAGNLMINEKETGHYIIVKGGGWNSNPFYLQTGASQFFPATAAHSFIGFRYVIDVIKK